MDPEKVKQYEALYRARTATARTILFAFLARLGCREPVWDDNITP